MQELLGLTFLKGPHSLVLPQITLQSLLYMDSFQVVPHLPSSHGHINSPLILGLPWKSSRCSDISKLIVLTFSGTKLWPMEIRSIILRKSTYAIVWVVIWTSHFLWRAIFTWKHDRWLNCGYLDLSIWKIFLKSEWLSLSWKNNWLYLLLMIKFKLASEN